jgi:hypothetical protein
MSDSIDRKLPSSGQEISQIGDAIEVLDPTGRPQKGVFIFRDPGGKRLECRIVRSPLAPGIIYRHIDVLPGHSWAHDLSADIVVEELSPALDPSRSAAALGRLSPGQLQALTGTLEKIRGNAHMPIQIIAVDPVNGTVLVEDAPGLLKTINMSTGETVAELYALAGAGIGNVDNPESPVVASPDKDDTAGIQEKKQGMDMEKEQPATTAFRESARVADQSKAPPFPTSTSEQMEFLRKEGFLSVVGGDIEKSSAGHYNLRLEVVTDDTIKVLGRETKRITHVTISDLVKSAAVELIKELSVHGVRVLDLTRGEFSPQTAKGQPQPA